MGQPITDHAAFFASAGQAVEELEALNTEVEHRTEVDIWILSAGWLDVI